LVKEGFIWKTFNHLKLPQYLRNAYTLTKPVDYALPLKSQIPCPFAHMMKFNCISV